MKPLVKIEIVVAIVSFGLIFVSGIAGKVAAVAGVNPKTAQLGAYAFVFLFFCLFAFASIGLMIHVFVVLQRGIGNAGVPMVSFLAQHETGITLAAWAFLGVGTLIAAPFALYDAGFRLPLRSKGTLVADIGMTMAEVKQRSTIPWRDGTHMRDDTQMVIQDMVFDYRIGDSAVHFPDCRYYWLRTSPHTGRLADINIGVSSEKAPLDDVETFERAAHLQLHNDGWMPGHYIADSEKTIQLWAGKRTTGDGRYWLKNDTVIVFERRRMDEEQRDEPARSGLFIVNLHFEPKAAAREVVFEPSAWSPGQ